MFDENYKVEEYVCNEQLTLRQYLTQTYYYGSPLVVRPKYWNERIANQAGGVHAFSKQYCGSIYVYPDI